jgi:hypothetical protein
VPGKVVESRLTRFSMHNPDMWVTIMLSSRPTHTALRLIHQDPDGHPASDAMWIRVSDLSCYLVFNPKGIDVGVIAHECLHATTDAMRKAGVGFSTHNDEIIAHYQSSMIRKVVGRPLDAGVKVPLIRGRKPRAAAVETPIGRIPRRRLPSRIGKISPVA